MSIQECHCNLKVTFARWQTIESKLAHSVMELRRAGSKSRIRSNSLQQCLPAVDADFKPTKPVKYQAYAQARRCCKTVIDSKLRVIDARESLANARRTFADSVRQWRMRHEP